MSTVADNLKYLWVAVFEDGHVMQQPADDRYSKHDDEAEWNPSAFRDVLEYPSKVKIFGLIQDNNVLVAAVNMTNGTFQIGDTPFAAHDQNLDLTGKELELIYFREAHIQTNVELEVQAHYINRYFIGWQIVGENVKQTIAVS